MERTRAALKFEKAGLLDRDAAPEARVVHGLSRAFLASPFATLTWRGMTSDGNRRTQALVQLLGCGNTYRPPESDSAASSLTNFCPVVLAFMPPKEETRQKTLGTKAALRIRSPNPILPLAIRFSSIFF